MQIGYVYGFRAAYPPKGGNHRHAYELVKGFIEYGNQVHVIDDPTMPGVNNYNSKNEIEKFVNSIDILYIRVDGREMRSSKTILEIMALKSNRPVVWEVNAPANESLAFSWLGGKTSTKKDSALTLVKRWFHAGRKYPAIWLEERHRRKIAKYVDFAICVSKALEVYCQKGLKIENTKVIPNGGPIIEFDEIVKRREKRTDSRFTVLYCGSAIYPWQGLQYITETIQLAHKKKLDMKFKLAVNQKTEDLPELSNVEILEGQNHNQIIDLVCTSDVCLAFYPEYFWSKWGFHNSPMKLFEYMGCATSTLSSNIGQMADLIRPDIDGYLCENKPQKIIEKLLLIKKDNEQRERIGKKGWSLVQNNLNWRNNVKQTVNIFRSLIDKESPKCEL